MGLFEISAEEMAMWGGIFLCVCWYTYLLLSVEHRKQLLDVLGMYSSALYCYTSCVLKTC